MGAQPVIIGGTGRCGTTIMKRTLLRHPQVTGSRKELRWINENPADMVEIDLSLDWDKVEGWLEEHPYYHDKPYWVEDSPESAIFFDEIVGRWPDTTCIHMIRHPLDTLASINYRTCHLVNGAPQYWCNGNLENARRIAWIYETVEEQEHGFEVRLEDLVHSTEFVLSEVCKHIGLPFDDEMLKGNLKERHAHENRYHKDYPDGLTREELEEALPVLNPWIKKFGYN